MLPKFIAQIFVSTTLLLSACAIHAEQTPPAEPTPTAAPAPTPSTWQLHYQKRVELFRAENETLPKDARHIVFLGDSLTEGMPTKTLFPDLPVLNRGISSDGVTHRPGGDPQWRGITNRMEESIFACNPSHLIMLIGTNDVADAGVGHEYWFDAYQKVLDNTLERFPDVEIILVTLPPSGTKYKRHEFLNSAVLDYNDRIRTLATERGFSMVDLHSLVVDENGMLPENLTRDGLHLTREAYDRWATVLRPMIEKTK